jgi:rhomboid family GlyGly-CTERM serine protease
VSPHRRLPLCTLALVAAAVASDASPWLSSWFVFERSSIESGQLWRVFTGHLVHELPELALLDLFALALLAGWVELRARGMLLPVLAASALVSSCAVLFLTDFDRYLGSSALACGLLAAAIVLEYAAGRRKLAAVAGLLLVGKLVAESYGYSPAGLGSLPEGFQPALAAHAGGTVAGCLTGLICFGGGAPGAKYCPRGTFRRGGLREALQRRNIRTRKEMRPLPSTEADQ